MQPSLLVCNKLYQKHLVGMAAGVQGLRSVREGQTGVVDLEQITSDQELLLIISA